MDEKEILIDGKTGEVSESLPIKSPIVLPAVSPEKALEAWKAYEDLKKQILTKEDIQIIQGKEFLKKSFWKKCATFFNLSVELLSERRVSETDSSVTFEVVYRAVAPNGRATTGDGACNTQERGRENSIHNTRSTAHTRASNRAVSNLVGGGEVSAEEVDLNDNKQPSKQKYSEVELAAPAPGWHTMTLKKEGASKSNKNLWWFLLENDQHKVFLNVHSKDWLRFFKACEKGETASPTDCLGAQLKILVEQNGKYMNVIKWESVALNPEIQWGTY